VNGAYVPAAIELKIVIAEDDSLLVAEVSGGNPPYNYLWSNGSTNKSILRTPGMHSVTVTDNNGCVQVATILITHLYNANHRGKGFVLYPNPANKQVYLATLDKQPLMSNLHITIVSSAGHVMHKDVLNSGQNKWIIPTYDWSAGSYWLQMRYPDGEKGVLLLQVVK
jgi:hypothetical protein